MLKHLAACLFSFAFLATSLSAASAERRIALVIGNSAYAHTAPLKNPSNDATDMAETLRALGFEVIEGTDLSKREMVQLIRTFAEKLDDADVGLFFYAGHGLQVDGRNFLAPVDATLKSDTDLDFETVEFNLVLKQLERNARLSIVFLDACRDNPLAANLAQASRSLSIGRGLAPVEKAVGMMIAFSTQPGNVALDGDGRNSPFTAALLRHISAEGASINDMMIDVRNDVLEATDGKQVPWENSSLTGKFFFKPAATQTAEDNSAEIAALRAEIARLRANQSKLLESQQDQLAALEDKLQSETGNTASPPASRVIAVEPAAGETKTANLDPGDIAPDDIEAAAGAVSAKEEAPQPEPEIDQAALSRDIQTKLKELGCYGGKIDGDWGRGTRGGVAGFNGIANLSLNVDEAEQATLDALNGWQGQHCPDKKVVRQKRPPAAKPDTPVTTKKTYTKPPKQARQDNPKHDIETDTVHQQLRPAR